MLALACAPAVAQPAAWPPAVTLAEDQAGDPVLAALLAEDRRWLAAQPAVLLRPPAEDGAAGGDDLLAWLQQAERAAGPAQEAGSDESDAQRLPVRGHRDLRSRLRDRWLGRGYLAAAVHEAGGPGAPGLVVSPGPRHVVGAIAVSGDDFPGREALFAAWLPRPGDAFVPAAYLEAAAGVVAGCAERGHPFPIWLTRSLRVDPLQAAVAIDAVLMPGPAMVVGPQRSDLPAGRGEAFLIRAAGVPEGRPYRESWVQRGRQRLVLRDLYARVDEPLVHLTATDDTVGIIWRVEPLQRPNRLAVVLGLSRGDQGGTRLSGQVDLDLPNLAGTGRRLKAGWRDDGRTRSRFGFEFLEPLVLGTPLDTDLALESEVQQDAYTLFRVANRWRLPVDGHWGLELGVAWDRTTYPQGDLAGTRRLRARAGVQRLRGDPARSGWTGTFAVETARRSSTPRPADDEPQAEPAAGGRLGRQDGQRLIEVDLGGELWLRPEFSLAGRASYRQNVADVLPLSLPELYRFGGSGSVRGYRDDEFAGEKAAWGGIEARLGRVRRSRVYTFVDLGYGERTIRAVTGADDALIVTSATNVGFGLGLLTLAAPGRIDLAVGFPGSVDFETAMLHVSLQGGF